MTYIAFLRGINVGGHTVKMDRLRALFEEAGLASVRSYIQSGNVFFEAKREGRSELTGIIEERLRAGLGYEVPVFLRTIGEVEATIAADPFRKIAAKDDLRLCLVFAHSRLPADLQFPLIAPKGDVEILGSQGLDLFVVWHLINGKPPSAQTFLDKTLQTATTTRFFHTTVKILEAAKSVP